jgi:hypothetical protein
MTWTLIVFIGLGTFSVDIKNLQLSMQSQEACVAAGKNMQRDGASPRIKFICVSSVNGDVLEVKP